MEQNFMFHQLIGKDPDTGRDWGQEEKGTTEDEMAGWHHWLDGLESEWTLGLVMDREAWRAVIRGVEKSWTWLSDWTELNWWIKKLDFDIVFIVWDTMLMVFFTKVNASSISKSYTSDQRRNFQYCRTLSPQPLIWCNSFAVKVCYKNRNVWSDDACS